MYISQLLYGHFGCFHDLAVVDSGAYEHRDACIFLDYAPFCLDICPGVELLGHMAALVFKESSILFSIVAATIYISTNNVGG